MFCNTKRLFDMFVGEQMVLAVFVGAVAFGTVPKFQIRVVQLGLSADAAFMPVGLECLAVVFPYLALALHPCRLPRIVTNIGIELSLGG